MSRAIHICSTLSLILYSVISIAKTSYLDNSTDIEKYLITKRHSQEYKKFYHTVKRFASIQKDYDRNPDKYKRTELDNLVMPGLDNPRAMIGEGNEHQLTLDEALQSEHAILDLQVGLGNKYVDLGLDAARLPIYAKKFTKKFVAKDWLKKQRITEKQKIAFEKFVSQEIEKNGALKKHILKYGKSLLNTDLNENLQNHPNVLLLKIYRTRVKGGEKETKNFTNNLYNNINDSDDIEELSNKFGIAGNLLVITGHTKEGNNLLIAEKFLDKINKISVNYDEWTALKITNVLFSAFTLLSNNQNNQSVQLANLIVSEFRRTREEFHKRFDNLDKTIFVYWESTYNKLINLEKKLADNSIENKQFFTLLMAHVSDIHNQLIKTNDLISNLYFFTSSNERESKIAEILKYSKLISYANDAILRDKYYEWMVNIVSHATNNTVLGDFTLDAEENQRYVYEWIVNASISDNITDFDSDMFGYLFNYFFDYYLSKINIQSDVSPNPAAWAFSTELYIYHILDKQDRIGELLSSSLTYELIDSGNIIASKYLSLFHEIDKIDSRFNQVLLELIKEYKNNIYNLLLVLKEDQSNYSKTKSDHDIDVYLKDAELIKLEKNAPYKKTKKIFTCDTQTLLLKNKTITDELKEIMLRNLDTARSKPHNQFVYDRRMDQFIPNSYRLAERLNLIELDRCIMRDQSVKHKITYHYIVMYNQHNIVNREITLDLDNTISIDKMWKNNINQFFEKSKVDVTGNYYQLFVKSAREGVVYRDSYESCVKKIRKYFNSSYLGNEIPEDDSEDYSAFVEYYELVNVKTDMYKRKEDWVCAFTNAVFFASPVWYKNLLENQVQNILRKYLKNKRTEYKNDLYAYHTNNRVTTARNKLNFSRNILEYYIKIAYANDYANSDVLFSVLYGENRLIDGTMIWKDYLSRYIVEGGSVEKLENIMIAKTNNWHQVISNFSKDAGEYSLPAKLKYNIDILHEIFKKQQSQENISLF